MQDDEPLIIKLLQSRMAKNEPIYIGLGKRHFYLTKITEFPHGDQFGDVVHHHWKLYFKEHPEANATVRRIFPSDNKWTLIQEKTVGGSNVWRMEEDRAAN